jgi:hypothetical protein
LDVQELPAISLLLSLKIKHEKLLFFIFSSIGNNEMSCHMLKAECPRICFDFYENLKSVLISKIVMSSLKIE